jgi:hypothetical protein
VYTDNDLLSFERDPIRANSFGLTATGTVNMTAGGVRRITALSRIIAVSPDKVNETASIQLTPLR